MVWIAAGLLLLAIASFAVGISGLRGRSLFEVMFEMMPVWPMILLGDYKGAMKALEGNWKLLGFWVAQGFLFLAGGAFLIQVIIWILQYVMK